MQLFRARPQQRSQPVPRRPRTDAQRKRERILEAAAFNRFGADARLDDIARQAKGY